MMDSLATPRIDALTGLLESYRRLRYFQERLRTLQRRLDSARVYLAAPGGNRPLGEARLERVRAEYAVALIGLRHARSEAHRRLGLAGPADRRRIG